MGYLVLGGREVPVDFAVHDGRALGLWWEPPMVGCRRRRQPLRQIVLHHTGAENPPETVVNTLRTRRLSIHFTVHKGVVYQHADPVTTVCVHAGSVNSVSVGIEVISRGVAGRTPSVRKRYVAKMHGRKVVYLAFADSEVRGVGALVSALCQHLNVPAVTPLVRGELSKPGEFRGVIGHFHASIRKVDPSPMLLDELVSDGILQVV